MLKDTQAAIDELKKQGPVAIIGFCMGGSIAFLAATRLNGLSCAIAYYGGQIAKFADEKPKVPMQMHFGEKDQGIPMTDVAAIKAKRTESEIYTYPDAPHGFHCDERGSYNETASKTAWPRTMAFLQKHLKK
jgi:carboxymethylenebutenolidase